jgi:hypothetical protein
MPKVNARGLGPDSQRSGMSVPQILVLGVLALMGANYYMRISSSSQRYPASKPGAVRPAPRPAPCPERSR